MDLKDSLRAVRSSWWVVVLVTLIGAGAAVLLNATTPKQYESSVQFFVSTPSTSNQAANAANQFATQRVNSYVQLLSSSTFAQDVIDSSGVDLDTRAVQRKITGSADVNTVLLTATVTDTDRQRSLAIARAIGNRFPDKVDSVENASASAQIQLTVVSGPTLHQGAVAPKVKLNIAIGLVLGLAIGIAIAVLRRLLDTTVRDAEVLRREFVKPVVGTIGFDPAAKRAPLIVQEQARSVRAEAFRQLRTNLRFSDVDRPIKTLVVTSSVASEGKSATSTNLAMVFAEAGNSVLIVEADLRRPRVTEYLSLEREVGLTNVLAGQVDLDDALQPWGSTGLQVLPSGSIPPNPSELLGSQNMADLMAQLRARFDIVIVDTPPLLPVTDAAVAAKLCDGVVLVVRHGRTSRTNVSTSLSSLDAVGARFLGFVLNMAPRRSRGNARYDGYRYYEDETADTAGGRRAPGRDTASRKDRASGRDAASRKDRKPDQARTPGSDRTPERAAGDVGLGIVRQPESGPPAAAGADGSADSGTATPPLPTPAGTDPAGVGGGVVPADLSGGTYRGTPRVTGDGTDRDGAPADGRPSAADDGVWSKSGSGTEDARTAPGGRRRPRPSPPGGSRGHLAGKRRRRT